MIERHGSPILLCAGIAFAAAGFLATASTAQIALCVVGASLLVLAVVLTKTEGPLKIGPGGLEAELRRSASERAQSLAESLDASGLGDLSALADGTLAPEDVQTSQIRRAVSSLVEALERLDAAEEQSKDEGIPATVLLEAAHGLMATREW